jgi:hypothetical protein
MIMLSLIIGLNIKELFHASNGQVKKYKVTLTNNRTKVSETSQQSNTCPGSFTHTKKNNSNNENKNDNSKITVC